jgi:hypothetical protein
VGGKREGASGVALKANPRLRVKGLLHWKGSMSAAYAGNYYTAPGYNCFIKIILRSPVGKSKLLLI